MVYKSLEKNPKNPKHFVALCFILLKKNPELRNQCLYMEKVYEVGNKALFQCAYGYFWVSKNQQVISQEFLNTIPKI